MPISFANGVELQLTSNIILTQGMVDLTDVEGITQSNPCSKINHNPSYCSIQNDIVTIAYDLTIIPLIPVGKKGSLNIDIQNPIVSGYEDVRILESGIPVVAPIEFFDNTQKIYQIEYKIRVNGLNVHQDPQSIISFILEEQNL